MYLSETDSCFCLFFFLGGGAVRVFVWVFGFGWLVLLFVWVFFCLFGLRGFCFVLGSLGFLFVLFVRTIVFILNLKKSSIEKQVLKHRRAWGRGGWGGGKH